jgi:hypothetical protein
VSDDNWETTDNGEQLLSAYALLQTYWGAAVPAECDALDVVTNAGL